MSGETEDPETAADRLEAALERIAQAAERTEAHPADRSVPADAKEIAVRLDGLIDRLRTALSNRTG